MEVQAGRRRWAPGEKRRIVEETLKPGTSVAAVARAHEVNANQVHWWRQLYRKGMLSEESQTSLLPVKISGALPEPQSKATSTGTPGVIEIDLGHARVRIEGAADPNCVRAALEGLRR